jgi:hypothetical protein
MTSVRAGCRPSPGSRLPERRASSAEPGVSLRAGRTFEPEDAAISFPSESPICGTMLRLFRSLPIMPKVHRTRSPRRLRTSSDLSVPSAQTELLLSDSLVDAAASIQDALLDGQQSQQRNGRSRPRRAQVRAKLRGRAPVIELKLQ